jgi:hypothetical protein
VSERAFIVTGARCFLCQPGLKVYVIADRVAGGVWVQTRMIGATELSPPVAGGIDSFGN